MSTSTERVREVIHRVPWWAVALFGLVVVAVLSVPQALRLGGGGADNYPWYVQSDGRVLTGLIIDQVQYFRLTDAAADRAWGGTVVQPFTSRGLAPWLAGQTGLPPATALTLTNVAMLALGTVALTMLARQVVGRRSAALVTVAVWAISFPVFWYTGKGLVDAAAVGLVPVVLLAAHHRRWTLTALAIAAAVAMKETAIVVLVPLVVAQVLQTSDPPGRRVGRIAVALLGAAAGLFLPRVGFSGADVTFAPWLPPSWVTVRQMLVMNLAGVGRLGQFFLTAGPGLLAAALWLPGLSRRPREDRVVVIPLLAGVAAAVALGVWSMISALFDGRTVWMSLPFAALLLGRWTAVTPTTERVRELRRTVRRWLLPGVAFLVVWVLLGAYALVSWGDGGEEDDSVAAGFAAVPATSVSDPSLWEHHHGTGDAAIPPPDTDGSPYLLDVRGDGPVQVEIGSRTVPGSPADSALVLVDPADGEPRVRTDGDWEVEVLGIDAAMPWEFLSPLRGEDPTVLLIPGALRRPVELGASFDDPEGRIRFVGDCGDRSCSLDGPDGTAPAGTEAVVIEAAGSWELVPSWLPR